MPKSLLVPVFLLAAALACGAPANPPPEPPSGGAAPGRPARPVPPEVAFYNEGTILLFQKQWAAAQRQFEAALAVDETMADAHNNLAYVLRKQGPENRERALAHYARALELRPDMPEALMYRGALHALAGRTELARADLAALERQKSRLAGPLRKVIATGREEEPEQFYGVAKKRR